MKNTFPLVILTRSLKPRCLVFAALMSIPFASQTEAQTIAITNADFTDGTTGYTLALDRGVAGAYSDSNPYGSTATFGGGNESASTAGFSNVPAGVSSAGFLQLDANDVSDPGGPYPSTSIIYQDGGGSGDVRIASANGALGSYYQNTGALFLPDTTYTFSAYVTGNGNHDSGESFTGVGLSGGSPLTLSEIETNNGFTPVDGFNADGSGKYNDGIVGPDYTSLVSMGHNPLSTFVQQTVTLNTAADPSLVGQDIYINLLANSDEIAGSPQYFTHASLTYQANIPEPSTGVLSALGLIPLALLLRSRRALFARLPFVKRSSV